MSSLVSLLLPVLCVLVFPNWNVLFVSCCPHTSHILWRIYSYCPRPKQSGLPLSCPVRWEGLSAQRWGSQALSEKGAITLVPQDRASPPLSSLSHLAEIKKQNKNTMSGYSTTGIGPAHSPRVSCVPMALPASACRSLVGTLSGPWAEQPEGSRALTPPGETLSEGKTRTVGERSSFLAPQVAVLRRVPHCPPAVVFRGAWSPSCPLGNLPRNAPCLPPLSSPPCFSTAPSGTWEVMSYLLNYLCPKTCIGAHFWGKLMDFLCILFGFVLV